MNHSSIQIIGGNIVDVFNDRIFSGKVHVQGEQIVKIESDEEEYHHFILPGFIDSHVHIESTMLTPARLATQIVPRGTIAIVTDPHEIANVTGVEGVEFMIRSAAKVPLKCFFGAPSCVPATSFESSGAILGADDIGRLLDKPEVYLLSEMMNFPGVVNGDKEVLRKILAAKERGLPIDGHAPGLRGDALKKYASAGISTDHESSSLEEALEKIENGMKIQIREGSAARNFISLAPLFDTHPNSLMLCTDDIHPDELLKKGHIDRLIRKGLGMKINLFKLLRATSVIPVQHYKLPVGLLRSNDPADFIVVDNLSDFNVVQTFINGRKVYDQREGLSFTTGFEEPINNFVKQQLKPGELEIRLPENKTRIRAIQCFDGELVTYSQFVKPKLDELTRVVSDTDTDLLKLVVINRYKKSKPAIAFIKGFRLKHGALATSVAHDSHNVVAVGVSDDDIVRAVNRVMENGGGMVAAYEQNEGFLPLPVAGLMSLSPAEEVAEIYERVEKMAHQMGSNLAAPFMTLSFMSLLVIPKLKLSDKGLFDVDNFSLISMFD